MNYERLLSYGNIIQLKIQCDPDKLIKEISTFPFRVYNTVKKNNNRYGLSVTSLDGELNGDDLESLYDTGLKYNEMSFSALTDVYFTSQETRRLVDPFRDHIGRTHFLSIRKGGYFPPHRDDIGADEQQSFRIIVPIVDCNTPNFYLLFDGDVVNLNPGYAYFMNTNLEHTAFSFSDSSLLMVMNVKCCDESIRTVLNNFYRK